MRPSTRKRLHASELRIRLDPAERRPSEADDAPAGVENVRAGNQVRVTNEPSADEEFFQAAPSAAVTGGVERDVPPPVPPRLGLLAALAPEEFDVVARAARLAHLPAHAIVFHQGDGADRFYIVVDGAVEVARDGTAIATLGPESFFGEGALLVHGTRSATVTTVVETTVWSIGFRAFEDAVSHHLLAHDEAGAEIERRLAESPDR